MEDYKKYLEGVSFADLMDISLHIDKLKFPEKYELLEQEKARRLIQPKSEKINKNNNKSGKIIASFNSGTYKKSNNSSYIQKNRKSEKMFFVAFISIFYLVGFWLMFKGVNSYFDGQLSLIWPEVSGTIIKCDLIEEHDENTTWHVDLKYKYSVAGNQYEGDNLAFGYSGSSNFEQHQSIFRKLKSADKLFVKYDPENPRNSVIAAGFNKSTFLTLAFAITWLLFVIGFTVLWYNSSGLDAQILNQIKMINA